MLSSGIYEQIVNTRINTELAKLDPEQYDIQLEALDAENARLRVIATTYTQATDYKAIMTLAELPNTTVKINYETNHARMHAKSYLFKRDTGFSTAYIGSSNLSNPALTGGLEWNVKVTEKESFDIVKKFSVSFESYWNDDTFETFDPNDDACRKKLQDELSKPMFEKKNQRHLQLEFRPYAYQQEILDNLEAEREVHGHYNNLVVAATGAHTIILTSQKDIEIRTLRTCLFFWPAAGSG